MGESWLVKHAPRSNAELVHPASQKLVSFINDFAKQKRKAMLLYGPTGSGKTSAVYAIAVEQGLEVVEVNASDTRNAEQINAKLGNAIKQRSLFGGSKLILVDELDGVSGNADRGGVQAITALIENSIFPIVLTANDPTDKKFSALRKKAVMVEFDLPSVDDVNKILSRICTAEKIQIEPGVIKTLARRSGGDVRAAINDLQLLAQSGQLTDRGVAGLSDRSRTEQLTQALVKVFKSTDPLIAISAFDDVNTDLDECFLWVDHNLPREYTKPEDLERAYDSLSKADIYRKRIRRWQHWRFLIYVNTLITAGVAVAKDVKYTIPPKYERTKRLLKLWQAKMRYQRRMSIAEKIAENTHSSRKSAIESTIPYLSIIFKNSPQQAKAITEELDLDADEIAWLAK